MSLITWNSSYSIGLDKVDDQHKELVFLINKLHDAMKARQGKEKVGEIIDGLLDYTKFHFSAEEKMLEKNKYPQLSGHKLKHKEFINKITSFKDRYSEGDNLTLPMETMSFLNDWLISHIQKVDKQYAAYFSEHNMTDEEL